MHKACVCDQFKPQVSTVAVDVLGIEKTKHRDQFDENDAAISKLLNEKNRLHEKHLSTDGPVWIAAGSKTDTVVVDVTSLNHNYPQWWWCEVLGRNFESL